MTAVLFTLGGVWLLPRELLVTSRLSRHAKGDGWRASVARWICVHLLDRLDPCGRHCK